MTYAAKNDRRTKKFKFQSSSRKKFPTATRIQCVNDITFFAMSAKFQNLGATDNDDKRKFQKKGSS